jgi:molybdopterin molybdotransferase
MALMSVAEALAHILHNVRPLNAETVPLRNAQGRVLAKPVKAIRDQPPFNASAMDGYAVRSADIEVLPTSLVLSGTAAAGHGFTGTLREGQAIRILTGAPLPKGADTIVIQEMTKATTSKVTINSTSGKSRNIRPRGLDFRRGDQLIARGTVLSARHIGLAAAGNAANVWVHERPHVVIFTTGDELVMPGQSPRWDQIISSNSLSIEAMVTVWGADVTNLGIVKDSLKATEAAIKKGLNADILVTTGGASVGDHDFIQQALKNCGVKIGFWKIALRPGKPLMFGTKSRTRVLGLPGNPVSALVCARIFLKPLILALQGLEDSSEPTMACVTQPLPENDNRKDYIRATLQIAQDGTRTVTPHPQQDSSMQRTLALSHCLIMREPHAKAADIGESVNILILDF